MKRLLIGNIEGAVTYLSDGAFYIRPVEKDPIIPLQKRVKYHNESYDNT